MPPNDQTLSERPEGERIDAGDFTLFPKQLVEAEEARKIGAKAIDGTDLLAAPASNFTQHSSIERAAGVASALSWLAGVQPQLVPNFLAVREPPWAALLPLMDPLASFDPEISEAVLSPLGLVHLYREYFFELETFLGPPVGHVWLSPGGTVELIEVNTRRTLTDRLVEIFQESITRSERAVAEQDELSEAVQEENQRNIKLGVTANVGGNLGVWHAEASASFSVDTTHRQARETAHKYMRQQSEKISSELRRNFRTAFRTTTEVTDTSSRRYVVQNSTDKLVNYELRRKMRKVAVQVQHIGTQLCWQVFVSEPGHDLAISELVHIARPDDTESEISPPDAPVILAPKEQSFEAIVPFRGVGNNDDRDELYTDGMRDGDRRAPRIDPVASFSAVPPDHGYELAGVQLSSIDRVNPEEDLPFVAASFRVTSATEFTIRLDQVNFEDQPSIRFLLKLIWNPPDQTAAIQIYEAKLLEYTNERRKREHLQALTLLRERLEKAGDVPRRPASDLRDEERTVIYRRLLEKLFDGYSSPTPHVTSELIRSLFDIDQMLYFVAPEWWRPRDRFGAGSQPRFQSGGSVLTQKDRVGWGGPRALAHGSYLISEEAQPVPFGSSLGWLLQTDADDHRNAFLNAPWVKAIVPIRPGRELAALNWLQHAHVEGTEGLSAQYGGAEPSLQGMTLKEALVALAERIRTSGTSIDNTLATERVFESGFNPLEQGFRVDAAPYQVFDQWVEILPTDQVVALEYEPTSNG